jgi:hypothetical protein
VTIHNDVLITAACIADNPAADEQTIVESMVAQGYEVLRAEVLVVFVPLGAEWVLTCLRLTDQPLAKAHAAISDSLGR